MPTLTDEEFGDITVRTTSAARHIRISVAPDGSLRASMPRLASMRSLKRLIGSSRAQIRSMLDEHRPDDIYTDGNRIGKSHSLIITRGAELKVTRQKLTIIATLPDTVDVTDPLVQDAIRKEVRAALRTEAKHYLPRRLSLLASRLHCTYERVRFSHASSRWGSCSSSGTISLNIALMKLPFELIDYVLVHELCHTQQMNHSKDFWQLVAQSDPEYHAHRKELKNYTPTI